MNATQIGRTWGSDNFGDFVGGPAVHTARAAHVKARNATIAKATEFFAKLFTFGLAEEAFALTAAKIQRTFDLSDNDAIASLASVGRIGEMEACLILADGRNRLNGRY